MSHHSPLQEMTDRAGATYADDAGWSMPADYGDIGPEYRHARTGAVVFAATPLADEVPDLDPLLHMEVTFGFCVNTHIRCHDSLGVPGYDIVCLNALAPGLWRMLTEAGAKPAGLRAYDILRVEAGTPVYGR